MKMKVPKFLKLCSMLTSQSFVADQLETQGHVIKSWMNGEIKSRRSVADFHRVRDSVADVYEEFPHIASAIDQIEVEVKNPRHAFLRARGFKV